MQRRETGSLNGEENKQTEPEGWLLLGLLTLLTMHCVNAERKPAQERPEALKQTV